MSYYLAHSVPSGLPGPKSSQDRVVDRAADLPKEGPSTGIEPVEPVQNTGPHPGMLLPIPRRASCLIKSVACYVVAAVRAVAACGGGGLISLTKKFRFPDRLRDCTILSSAFLGRHPQFIISLYPKIMSFRSV